MEIEKRITIEEFDQERAINYVNTFIDRVDAEEFLNKAENLSPEVEDHIHLLSMGNKDIRNLLIEESLNPKGKRISEYNKSIISYWTEQPRFDNGSVFESNKQFFDLMIKNGEVSSLYDNDNNFKIFVVNILRGLEKWDIDNQEYPKEQIYDILSRILQSRIIDFTCLFSDLKNCPEDSAVVELLCEAILNNHVKSLIEKMGESRNEIPNQIRFDNNFWSRFDFLSKCNENVKEQYSLVLVENIILVEEDLKKLRISEGELNLDRIGELESNQKALLTKLFQVKGEDRTTFDYIKEFPFEDDSFIVMQCLANGIGFKDDLAKFLIKDTSNVEFVFSLYPEFWISKTGVDILSLCMIENYEQACKTLDALISFFDTQGNFVGNSLRALKHSLKISLERNRGEKRDRLPDDSFLARLSYILETYLQEETDYFGSRKRYLAIEKPPKDGASIRQWSELATLLRGQRGALSLVPEGDDYQKFKDMLDFCDDLDLYGQDEKEFLSWLRNLDIESPWDTDEIDSFWNILINNVPSLANVELETIVKRDILVISSIIVLDTIYETARRSHLNNLLGLGIPSYDKLGEKDNYDITPEFKDFKGKLEKFGFRGTEEQWSMSYAVIKSLMRLDIRGLGTYININSGGISVLDPYSTLDYRRKTGKEIQKTADPTEEKTLTWMQIAHSRMEVDYTYGSEVWNKILSGINLTTGGASRTRRALEKGEETPSMKMQKNTYGEIRIFLSGTDMPALIIPPVKNPAGFVVILKKIASELSRSDKDKKNLFDQAMDIARKEAVKQ